jgi:hypothetical protein
MTESRGEEPTARAGFLRRASSLMMSFHLASTSAVQGTKSSQLEADAQCSIPFVHQLGEDREGNDGAR